MGSENPGIQNLTNCNEDILIFKRTLLKNQQIKCTAMVFKMKYRCARKIQCYKSDGLVAYGVQVLWVKSLTLVIKVPKSKVSEPWGAKQTMAIMGYILGSFLRTSNGIYLS